MLLLSLLVAMSQPVVRPDGTRLHPSDRCYTLSRAGQPVGVERQIVRAVRLGRDRGWDIVVHQRVAAMRFDLRDHFVVRRADLTPITFDSRKDGVEHVRLTYASGRVTGWKQGHAGREAIDTAFSGSIWDGNLWGPTFAALPLAAGRSFTLPFFQYDQGLGTFTVSVRAGDRPGTWAIDAGTRPDRRSAYTVTDRGETLGVTAGPFVTTPGGDCAALG